jgi:uncharacterized protein YjdB
MVVGNTLQLTATVAPSDATNKNVTWSSSDPTIATVSAATGLITAVTEGTVTITTTTDDGGFVASCVVIVNATPLPATGITISQTTANLMVGATLQLKATVIPSGADQNVTWNSSDQTIATVDETGLVTAVSDGNVIITVFSEAGSYTAICKITVSSPAVSVTGVTLNKTTAELKVGESLQLSATVARTNATNKNVTWSSSDSKVATVSATGLVTAVGEGSVKITATTADGNKVATCTISVTSSTGISNVQTGISTYISGNILYVQSPVAEKVQVYSISGVLLYSLQKAEGNATYSVNQSKGAMLIVKGGSGWVKKSITN